MKREDLEKLLGGYATGTLTEAERRALYEAALTDQALFDALVGEEALREVLEDPRCRRQIEQALRAPRPGILGRAAGWMRRPRGWELAGALATAAAVAIIAVRTTQPGDEIQVAQYRKAEAPPVEPERQVVVPGSREAQGPEVKSSEVKSPELKSEAPPAQLPAAVPDRPPAVARSRRTAEPHPAAPPPAAPAQPAQVAEMTATDVAEDVSKSESSGAARAGSSGAAGAPVQLFSAGAPPAAQTVAFSPIRYEVLVRTPEGNFVPADPRRPVEPGVPVRLVLTANRPGNLAVFDEERNLLFSMSAAAGVSYTVDPPPAVRKFTVMLAPGVASARTAATAAAREVPQAETQPASDVVLIDLTRPRD